MAPQCSRVNKTPQNVNNLQQNFLCAKETSLGFIRDFTEDITEEFSKQKYLVASTYNLILQAADSVCKVNPVRDSKAGPPEQEKRESWARA